MKKLILVVIGIILLFTSCGIFKKCPQSVLLSVVDSSYTETIYNTKIDTFKIPQDSAFYYALLECINGNVVERNIRNENGKHSQVTVAIKDGTLVAKCVVDSFSVYKEYQNSHTTTVEVKTITKQLPPITTNILTQWQIFQLWLGRILLVVGLGFIGIKFGFPLLKTALKL